MNFQIKYQNSNGYVGTIIICDLWRFQILFAEERNIGVNAKIFTSILRPIYKNGSSTSFTVIGSLNRHVLQKTETSASVVCKNRPNHEYSLKIVERCFRKLHHHLSRMDCLIAT